MSLQKNVRAKGESTKQTATTAQQEKTWAGITEAELKDGWIINDLPRPEDRIVVPVNLIVSKRLWDNFNMTIRNDENLGTILLSGQVVTLLETCDPKSLGHDSDVVATIHEILSDKAMEA